MVNIVYRDVTILATYTDYRAPISHIMIHAECRNWSSAREFDVEGKALDHGDFDARLLNLVN